MCDLTMSTCCGFPGHVSEHNSFIPLLYATYIIHQHPPTVCFLFRYHLCSLVLVLTSMRVLGCVLVLMGPPLEVALVNMTALL